ncbi:MAG TPA: DUF6644 family protein, partial [Candidatus Polarisedimenticolia bacterium]|nr:DUF6644 family protein [Candidatus Polarisedimenticolia bacterium]
ATKYYYMKAFWVKMAALALALLFTFAVRRRVVMAGETRMSSIWNKLVAGVSLGLWGTRPRQSRTPMRRKTKGSP